MKAFYFIITPLNYVNALEFRFNSETNVAQEHHLIIITDHEPRINTILKTADPNHWNSIEVLFSNKLKRKKPIIYSFQQIKRKKIIQRFLEKIQQDDIIVLGNFNHSYCQYIYKNSKNSNCYFIDDGFATLSVPNELTESTKPKKIRSKIDHIIFKLQSFKPQEIKFFTIFKLSHKDINCYENKYSALKRLYLNEKKIKNEVLFIGQPLVELGIMKENVFNKYIESIYHHYNNQGFRLIYSLHPGERIDLKPKFLKTVRYEYPIEIQIIQNETCPSIITSFYSTGVFTLSKMLGKNMNFEFWLPKELEKNKSVFKLFEIIREQSSLPINSLKNIEYKV